MIAGGSVTASDSPAIPSDASATASPRWVSTRLSATRIDTSSSMISTLVTACRLRQHRR